MFPGLRHLSPLLLFGRGDGRSDRRSETCARSDYWAIPSDRFGKASASNLTQDAKASGNFWGLLRVIT